MQCCVPSCDNKSNARNISKCDGIAFRRLPYDTHLRDEFLGALGLQHAPLQDSALFCSQHFLPETDSGSQQLCTDAVPSTVQVCMTCLNTDSEMCLMDKHKLKEAYEMLTGYPPCEGENLTQALCVQCAHKLRHFSRFRDMSLRARSLMMELVKQHELITIKHIKMLQSANNHQKNNLVSTILGPDHCDLYIVEHSEDRQTDEDETVHEATVEHNSNSVSVEEDTQVIKEEESNADCVKEFNEDLIKYENAPYMCTVCYDEFLDVHEFSTHMSMHHFRSHGDATTADSAQTMFNPLPCRPVKNENEARATGGADTAQRSARAPDIEHRTTSDRHLVVKLYDVMKYHKNVVPKQDDALTQARQAVSCDSLSARTARADAQCRAARAHDEPAACTLTATGSRTRTFTCNVCLRVFTRKNRLIAHIKNHTGEKSNSSKISPYKCTEKSSLVRHRRSHTGEKLFSCEICSYKCTQKSSLVTHVRIHTGEKPFSCETCSYKCTQKSRLVTHMMTHTGERPYSCERCSYKCTVKSNLLKHIRVHTGEKPYSCEICSYKCTQKSRLVSHVRTHTGERPYSCERCSYKCTVKSNLLKHFRVHTGEKPYSCEICSYKCTQKSRLVSHVRTHTGERPYSCERCSYKCTVKSNLLKHFRVHTGEKPYSCEICSYKCTQKSSLVRHMRTHIGKKL